MQKPGKLLDVTQNKGKQNNNERIKVLRNKIYNNEACTGEKHKCHKYINSWII